MRVAKSKSIRQWNGGHQMGRTVVFLTHTDRSASQTAGIVHGTNTDSDREASDFHLCTASQ